MQDKREYYSIDDWMEMRFLWNNNLRKWGSAKTESLKWKIIIARLVQW